MTVCITRRLGLALLFAGVLLPFHVEQTAWSAPAKKTVKRKTLSPFEQAVAARDALENKPSGQATRAEYNAVMDQFRAIYHGNPADLHAPDAIFAVAELLSEAGAQLNEPKLSQNAVGQYEFLRKNYPASHYRADALLAEAHIEQNDLRDFPAAKAKYQELLKVYPHSEKAPEAKASLEALKHGTPLVAQKKSDAGVAAVPIQPSVPVAKSSAPQQRQQAIGSVIALPPSETAASTPLTTVLPVFEDVKPSGRLATVTGIRHWSTASYTRVAIDLGDEVKYEAARVPHPDRIYFDLHGAKLAQELAGKTFDVTDDGFLKRIRAAQFSNDVTRVVLDVSDVTEYSAFLLPNPYRLIIDIHGGLPSAAANTSMRAPDASTLPPTDAAKSVQKNGADAAAMQNNPALATAQTGISHPDGDVALDAAAAANAPLKPTDRKPATAAMNVPNTTSRKTSNTDVAALSQQPGKVNATAKPTSQPIAAMVPDVASEEPPAVAPLPSKSKRGKNTASAAPAHEAELTADGQRSLARALGLKIGRIVVDAGHGGHDSGTLGVAGIEEKDVVLDVALRLGKLLKERLGVDVIYTRSDDTFIPLETRTAIANKAQADLFISIHANSSTDATARGVETYYLNFTSDPTALEVATRENAVSDQSIHQLSDLVKKITLKDKIDESREFALDVQGSLYGGLERGNTGLKNRGIKKAPFVVLIGANMPSILAEISFVTNPKDASQLKDGEYRQRVAESLYKGIAKYANGMSGVRPSAQSVAAGN